MPGVAHPRRPRRTTSPTLAGLLITGLLLTGVVLLSPGDEMQTVRRLFGIGPDRFGSPPEFTPGEGSHAFLLTQPGSDEPVGYDPCRPVEYVVNPAGAPSDWRELVDAGAAHTSWATGLELVYAGTTDERPQQGNAFAQHPSPVVIGFADEDEIEALSGRIAGVGGSRPVRDRLNRTYFVTGSIALDTDVFDGPSYGPDRAARQAIVDHEFGHVVGLDHVEDPGELMNGDNLGRTTYGPGDLEGLARLGAIPCR